MTGKIVEYKGSFYTVEAEIKFRHPDSGDWITGYLYCSKATGEQFVREKEDFNQKFRVVESGKSN